MFGIYWLTEDETDIASGPHSWPTRIIVDNIQYSNKQGIEESMLRLAHGRPAPEAPTFDPATQRLGPVILVNGELEYEIQAIPQEELDAAAAQAEVDLMNSYINAVQSHMDTEAQSKGYDNIFTMCTYAVSTHTRFGPEGLEALAWRDACWTYANDVLADVEAAIITIPTIEDFITGLPVPTWPEE